MAVERTLAAGGAAALARRADDSLPESYRRFLTAAEAGWDLFGLTRPGKDFGPANEELRAALREGVTAFATLSGDYYAAAGPGT